MIRNQLSGSAAVYKSARQDRRSIAYHEAGHAAAIYLNNKAWGMPPVFFNLCCVEARNGPEDWRLDYQTVDSEGIGRVEGGRRLIQFLPASFACLDRQLAATRGRYLRTINDYWVAFDLDIINLLAGPLAEAKYVAVNDGEIFNYRLVNLPALENYGGSFDLDLVNNYLDSYSDYRQQQDEKLNELFMMAFHFVNDYDNWKAITKLADHIIERNKNPINYKEAVAVLG